MDNSACPSLRTHEASSAAPCRAGCRAGCAPAFVPRPVRTLALTSAACQRSTLRASSGEAPTQPPPSSSRAGPPLASASDRSMTSCMACPGAAARPPGRAPGPPTRACPWVRAEKQRPICRGKFELRFFSAGSGHWACACEGLGGLPRVLKKRGHWPGRGAWGDPSVWTFLPSVWCVVP